MEAIIIRQVLEAKQTLGTLVLLDAQGKQIFSCKTLELPDKKNQKQVSCIPVGKYKITPRTSSTYGLHFLVNNVPNRDAILIHNGNYYTDILGCILVGNAHTDINGDGYRDVTSSKVTLQKLTSLAPKGFNLTIITV